VKGLRECHLAPIGYLLISKGITEQKVLEEQLRRKNEELEEQYLRVQESNRLKSEFLAVGARSVPTEDGILGTGLPTEGILDGVNDHWLRFRRAQSPTPRRDRVLLDQELPRRHETPYRP
jgi:hypothetical protein